MKTTSESHVLRVSDNLQCSKRFGSGAFPHNASWCFGRYIHLWQTRGSLELLGGQWESHEASMQKEHWLELWCNSRMHQRAVPVPLNVCSKALAWCVPDCCASLAAWHRPSCETCEILHCPLGRLMSHKIDNSIPETDHLLEIYWQIHKVIQRRKAMVFKSLQHCHLRKIFWQVSEHNSCA